MGFGTFMHIQLCKVSFLTSLKGSQAVCVHLGHIKTCILYVCNHTCFYIVKHNLFLQLKQLVSSTIILQIGSLKNCHSNSPATHFPMQFQRPQPTSVSDSGTSSILIFSKNEWPSEFLINFCKMYPK